MSCGVKMNYSKPSVIWVHRIRPRLYLGVFKNVIFSKKVKKKGVRHQKSFKLPARCL